MFFSFIGLVSLAFPLHSELTTVSALFTGLGFTVSWKYCFALGLGAVSPGCGGIVDLCERKHFVRKCLDLVHCVPRLSVYHKSRDLGT